MYRAGHPALQTLQSNACGRHPPRQALLLMQAGDIPLERRCVQRMNAAGILVGSSTDRDTGVYAPCRKTRLDMPVSDINSRQLLDASDLLNVEPHPDTANS